MMNQLPQSFWATLVLSMGVLLAIVGKFHPGANDAALMDIAKDIVIGALGAFSGHAVSSLSARNATINQPKVSLPDDASGK